MPRQGPKPAITKVSEDALKKRVRDCIERFRYYEERMKAATLKNKGNVDRAIYNASANVWNLAIELLMRGPVKKITDETLSGRRGFDMNEQLERRDDDERQE